MLFLVFLLGIGAISSLVYSFFIKKDKATNPFETFAKNGNIQNKIVPPPTENIGTLSAATSILPILENKIITPIPTEIYSIETDLDSKNSTSLSNNIKNHQHHFQEEHPDVFSYKKY